MVGSSLARTICRAVWFIGHLHAGHDFARAGAALRSLSLLDGIFDLISAIRSPSHHWAFLLEGIVGIIAGVVTFVWPGITGMVLLYLIAFWAIFTGVLEIASGVRLRTAIANEILLILMGILSVLFGVFIVPFPGAGALAIAFWIGAYALVFGIMLIALAFRLRGFRQIERCG
jgi:uncharacterized membrane protein HdeD (DUF308 family)